VFKLLSQYEGFKQKPYRDSNKKLWTVGYGTLIGDGSDEALKNSQFNGKAIDEAEAAKIATNTIAEKTKLISGMVGEDVFNSYSPDLQAHLVSGAYRGDITGSPKTIALLKAGDFEGASKEYLNNNEYRNAGKGSAGVIKRMNDAAAVIAKEKPQDFSTAVNKRIAEVEQQPRKVATVASAPASGKKPLLDFSAAVEKHLIEADKEKPLTQGELDLMERARRGEAVVVKPRTNPVP
jgi:GH24 family phage-related lysozyme (muramidase)